MMASVHSATIARSGATLTVPTKLSRRTGLMTQKTQNYIAGEWMTGASEIENRNPSDLSDVIGMYAQADRAQLDMALDAAHAAKAKWAKVGLEQRQTILHSIGE